MALNLPLTAHQDIARHAKQPHLAHLPKANIGGTATRARNPLQQQLGRVCSPGMRAARKGGRMLLGDAAARSSASDSLAPRLEINREPKSLLDRPLGRLVRNSRSTARYARSIPSNNLPAPRSGLSPVVSGAVGKGQRSAPLPPAEQPRGQHLQRDKTTTLCGYRIFLFFPKLTTDSNCCALREVRNNLVGEKLCLRTCSDSPSCGLMVAQTEANALLGPHFQGIQRQDGTSVAVGWIQDKLGHV